LETPSDRSATERFQRADAVFDAALDLPLDQQAAYVRRVCTGDPVLCADVERLLRAHGQSDGFLGVPAGDRAALLMIDPAMPNDTRPMPLPDRIGPYRINREIGRGGMGVVYLAERDDPDFPQRVALKVVRSATADGHSYIARFLTERRVLAWLEHPHIARLFDGGVTSDGLPYYTMAYCEGGSLAQRLSREGRLPETEALRIGRQLASALAAAHARGVVHRDVKPANVLFDADGSVRLSDFGVVKLLEDDSARSDTLLGTVAYLAPEQIRGQAVDHQTDLWALGVTLYEMIAGCRPFDGPSYAAVMHAIVSTEPAPLRQRVPAMPAAAEALVMRLLHKEAAARPQSAAAVLRELEGSAATVGHWPSGSRATARSRVGAAVLGALVMIAGGVAYFRSGSSTTTPAVESPAVVTLAVRPFVDNESGVADDGFVDGLSKELIATLGTIHGLRVSRRSGVFAFQHSAIDVRSFAESLGVDHVVAGSVRRSGDRRVVSVQVIRARDASVLWSHEYTLGDITDMFGVQHQTAEAVATAVRLQFALADVPRPSADAQARYEYALGRAAINNRRGGDLRRALAHFKTAIARDPEYAIAYSGLSDAYTSLANFGMGPPAELIDSARTTATRALTLDSTLAEARTSLGHALCTQDYRWNDAERQFRRAIEYEPGYIYARTTYAICLQDQGRFSEALAELDTARTLDPDRQAVGTVSGRVLVNDGRPDEAIKTLKRAIDVNSQSDMAWQQLGHAYLLKGLHPEALQAFRTAAKLTGVRDSAHLAYAYAGAGHRSEARRIVESLVASRRDRYVPPFHIAMAYAGLGEVDEAFRWLDLALAEHGSFLDGVKVTSAFAPLHADPRWGRLLAAMGLSAR
jgi:TolB-like protein